MIGQFVRLPVARPSDRAATRRHGIAHWQAGPELGLRLRFEVGPAGGPAGPRPTGARPLSLGPAQRLAQVTSGLACQPEPAAVTAPAQWPQPGQRPASHGGHQAASVVTPSQAAGTAAAAAIATGREHSGWWQPHRATSERRPPPPHSSSESLARGRAAMTRPQAES